MIKIITDTTSGLSHEISKRYHIPVIPQIINFGNQSFYEGINIDNPIIYENAQSLQRITENRSTSTRIIYSGI